MKRPFVSILWCVVIGSWLPLSALAQAAQQAKPESPELHRLSNDELLEQARGVFDRASVRLLAELRGVARYERLLVGAQRKTGSMEIPAANPPIPGAEEMAPPEVAKITLGNAENRLNAIRELLALTDAEKTLLDKQAAQIEAAQAAAALFASTFDMFSLFVMEVELRVQDGTLTSGQVPGRLTAREMRSQQKLLAIRQETLKEKASTTRRALDNIALRREEIGGIVIDYEARFASAKEKYAQALKRLELEQEHAAKTPQTLLAQIAELQEERVWLTSSVTLSRGRFDRLRASVAQIEQELEQPPPFDIAKLQITHAEEAGQAASAAEAITAHHAERIARLERLRSSLQSLVDSGESLAADANVLSDHVFKMQVGAGALETFVGEGKVAADAVPQGLRPAALADVGNTALERASDALAATEKAKQKLARIDGRIAQSQAAQQEVSHKLVNLNRIYQSGQRTRQWEERLKDQTAAQIVQSFRQNAETLAGSQLALEPLGEEFAKAQAAVQQAKANLDALKDPLLRATQLESLGEKRELSKALYGIAGLEFPEPEPLAPSAAAAAEPQVDSAAAPANEQRPGGEGAGDGDGQQDPPLDPNTEAYQNLLSTLKTVIDQQHTRRLELLSALGALNDQAERYANALSQTRTEATQLHANAVELKKRLGRGQLAPDDVPDAVTSALQSDVAAQLGARALAVLNQRAEIARQIERLSAHDEALEQAPALLAEVRSLAGRRLDVLAELRKLERDLARRRDQLSTTEAKSLEQAAVRRMQSDEGVKEMLLRFIPSQRAESLNEILRVYYVELTELSNKRNNLTTQKKLVELLNQLAQEEKPVIAKLLLPLVRRRQTHLESERDGMWARIRAQLAPQDATQILADFEKKTGRRIPAPAPVAEERRVAAIETATDLISDRDARIIAAGKWIDLFEKRLSPTGIDVEVGRNQDKLGVLDAQDDAIRRQVHSIAGRVGVGDDTAAPPVPDEEPATTLDKLRFWAGEIGVLREDRDDTRSEAAVRVLVQLALIIVAAMLLIRLINRLIDRLRKSGSERDPQTLFVLTFLQQVSRIAIWIVATIMALSVLGFNVGAVLAGLGIGGLAVAMASKDSLADIIGGISIVVAKSFKVGDIVLFKGELCEIEGISLRYTRIRDYSTNYLNTVPNARLAEREVINVTAAQPGLYLTMDIHLSIFTSAEQLKTALKTITDVVEENPDASLNWARLQGFGEYSFIFKFRFGVNIDHNHRVRTEVYEEIVRRFEQHGIEFAARPYLNVEGIRKGKAVRQALSVQEEV